MLAVVRTARHGLAQWENTVERAQRDQLGGDARWRELAHEEQEEEAIFSSPLPLRSLVWEPPRWWTPKQGPPCCDYHQESLTTWDWWGQTWRMWGRSHPSEGTLIQDAQPYQQWSHSIGLGFHHSQGGWRCPEFPPRQSWPRWQFGKNQNWVGTEREPRAFVNGCANPWD